MKYRRGKSKTLLLLAGFFFLFGFTLLISFGPTKLSCQRVEGDRVDCLLTRSVVFGYIEQAQIPVLSLKAAMLDERVKSSLESNIDGTTTYEKITPVYGVLLMGDRKIVFDTYREQREQQQKIVDRINRFLQDPSLSTWAFETRNYWLYFITLSLLVLSIGLLFRIALYRS